MTHVRTDTRGDGYILVSVLSVLAFVSALAVSLLLLSRNTIDTAAIASQALTDDAMVQSAASLAGYQLFVLKRPPEQVDGQQIRLDQGLMSLLVSSDAGKVDLNGSNQALLASAYQASGLKTLTPRIFAARVIDWRDADTEVLPGGAEGGDYAAAGLPYGPRDGGFRTVDDLQWVLGVTAADLDALRPLLTVYNPGGRLNVFSAPAVLIAALPGVDKEIAGLVETARGTVNPSSIARLADLLLVQASLIDATPPSTYRVTIDVRRNGSDQSRRVDVVMTTGSTPSQAYHILSWTGLSSTSRNPATIGTN